MPLESEVQWDCISAKLGFEGSTLQLQVNNKEKTEMLKIQNNDVAQHGRCGLKSLNPVYSIVINIWWKHWLLPIHRGKQHQ